MEKFKKNLKYITIFALLFCSLFVWVYEGAVSKKNLKVHFIDVGQGDAIFIDTPNGKQVLIDGGKNKKIVSELGRIMSFGDKKIDIIIATHPDSDHIGGLPEVFSRYEIGLFIESGSKSDTQLDEILLRKVREEGSKTLLAKRGQVIDLGDGVEIQILFPDRDIKNIDTNDASIVARLIFGQTSFLFTGDAGIKTENILMRYPSFTIDSDVLKAGHHGSRTSSSLSFSKLVSPLYSVISAGKNNSYGHPHAEVIDIFKLIGANIISTATHGTITFESNGEYVWVN